jgi:hypothetical protein
MISPIYSDIVDEPIALAIGHLVTEWATAQMFLLTFLSELMVGRSLGPDDDLAHGLVLVGMEPRILLGLIRAYLPQRMKPEAVERVGKAVDNMERAKDLRDVLVHCIWQRKEPKRMTAISAKAVGKIKMISRDFRATDIESAVQALQQSGAALLVQAQAAGYLTSRQPSLGRPY